MLETCPRTSQPLPVKAPIPPPRSVASHALRPWLLHPGCLAPGRGGLGSWRERLVGLSLLVWRGGLDSVVSAPVTQVKAQARRKA